MTPELAVITSRNALSAVYRGSVDPAAYHAWYETPRGAWIADRELDLMLALLRPRVGESLLNLGGVNLKAIPVAL